MLHVSIMDPPEVFAPKDSAERRKAVTLYREATKLADSISCIGELLRDRLTKETGKHVFLLNDFIEDAPLPVRSDSQGGVRVAIAGRIYNYAELELFLKSLGEAFTSGEVLWYGAANNASTSSLSTPSNVSIRPLAYLPRERIAKALAADCSFAYLSMPSAMPEFAIYSVPTKLVTYLEAGLPVAFHAPENSEINLMNERWRFGVNLNENSSVENLRDIVARRTDYRKGVKNLAEARYSKAAVMATVREILTITRTYADRT